MARTALWFACLLLLALEPVCSSSEQPGAGAGGSAHAGGSGGSGGSSGGGPTALGGAVEKGPFVLGSTVQVSLLDANGQPTGDIFSTQTKSDLGDFELTINHNGLVSIEGTGFYYNEVTGELSGASLTLRAYADLGTAPTHVNLITHLSYGRVAALADDGATFAAARDQAEMELRSALMIGPTGFNPGAPGVALNLLGGDNDANAYLFAVSAVVTQVAVMRAAVSGSVEANLQEVLNALSLDLAEDGMLLPGIVEEIQAAEEALDGAAVEAMLAARLVMIGSSATVPDIDRVLDSDNDGVANLHDSCPFIPNPTQEVVPGLCKWEAQLIDHAALENAANGAVGDFDADGDADVVLFPFVTFGGPEPHLTVLENDGTGTFDVQTQPITLLVDMDLQPGGGARTAFARDMDGDGALDVVFPAAGAPGGWYVLVGNGDGTFAPTFEPLEPNHAFEALVEIVDLDGDMHWDAVGMMGLTGLGVAMGNAGGSRDPAMDTGFVATEQITGVASGDFNGDGDSDLVVGEALDGQQSGRITILLGDGNGGVSSAGIANTQGYPTHIEVADYDGDGHVDVAAMVFDGATASLGVWLGDAQGGLTVAIDEPLSAPPSEWYFPIALRAVNGLATLQLSRCTLPIEIEQHSFHTLIAPSFGGPSFDLHGCVPIRGDVNADGHEDLLLLPSFGGDFDGTTMTVMLINP